MDKKIIKHIQLIIKEVLEKIENGSFKAALEQLDMSFNLFPQILSKKEEDEDFEVTQQRINNSLLLDEAHEHFHSASSVLYQVVEGREKNLDKVLEKLESTQKALAKLGRRK